MHQNQFKFSKTAIPFSLMVTLAACGGSSTSGPNASTSFANIIEDAGTLADEVAVIPYTDPATLPTSGSATYNGFIGVVLDNNAGVAGDLQLIANFAPNANENAITGSASNFFDNEENAIGGTLTLSNSVLDRNADTNTQFTFDADLSGDLTSDEGDISVAAFLLGDFTGTNHEFVEGFVSGTATLNDETLFLDGEFVAER